MKITVETTQLFELRRNVLPLAICVFLVFAFIGVAGIINRHYWSGGLVLIIGLIFFISGARGTIARFDSETGKVNVDSWTLFSRTLRSFELGQIAHIEVQEFDGIGDAMVELVVVLRNGDKVTIMEIGNPWTGQKLKQRLEVWLEGLTSHSFSHSFSPFFFLRDLRKQLPVTDNDRRK